MTVVDIAGDSHPKPVGDVPVMAPVIIIPAYQPGRNLLKLVNHLCSTPRQNIIVVDDGSSAEHREIFDALTGRAGVHLLRHAVNLGKGQALKTAFNYFLVTFPEAHAGVVTADADGQHLPEDVQRVAAALATNPTELVLGTRRFSGEVPWKSSLGNTLTRHIFYGLLGRKISDTQTGLRGIPRAFLADLLPVPASRYEFELEMLVKASEQHLHVREVPIETVYEDGNRGSHFNPIVDSLRIYFVFLRFLLLSLSTAALDFAVFTAAYLGSGNIFLSTATARLIAGAFNYHFARAAVFKSGGRPSQELVKYVALVIWLMIVSYTLLTGLVIFVGLSVYSSKIIAETVLFLASFAIQRLFVFKPVEPTAEATSTDWDAYYTRPSHQAQVTRKITTRVLLHLMQRYAAPGVRTICEFGGANSCFYAPMRAAYPQVDYLVLDNNAVGLDLLVKRWPADSRLVARNENILAMEPGIVRADIVYSVGLIEHFSPADTALVIQKHFSCARPGGLVIITFPTPTWLYRLTRMGAEQIGVWRFPDERPLLFDEVEREISKHGTILDRRINWPIILTQGIVVARAS